MYSLSPKKKDKRVEQLLSPKTLALRINKSVQGPLILCQCYSESDLLFPRFYSREWMSSPQRGLSDIAGIEADLLASIKEISDLSFG